MEGDLRSLLAPGGSRPKDADLALRLSLGVASGVATLGLLSYVHLDLKLENFLFSTSVDEVGRERILVKLANMGLTQNANGHAPVWGQQGTLYHQSYEQVAAGSGWNQVAAGNGWIQVGSNPFFGEGGGRV
ncbi:hypothetical protein FOA52_007122 [Chlamydomonas sp. UWO 241]|nr:hypothetical protein FOA52_007122 [Chlamydomonas sp. UWO 241]